MLNANAEIQGHKELVQDPDWEFSQFPERDVSYLGLDRKVRYRYGGKNIYIYTHIHIHIHIYI